MDPGNVAPSSTRYRMLINSISWSLMKYNPFLFYGQNCHRMDERSPLSEPFQKGNVFIIMPDLGKAKSRFNSFAKTMLQTTHRSVCWSSLVKRKHSKFNLSLLFKKGSIIPIFHSWVVGGEGQDMGLWWTNKYRIALP